MASRECRVHTRDHDGDIALRLRLALVDITVLFEVDGPTLLRAGGVLDLKLEDTIGLRVAGTGHASKQESKQANAQTCKVSNWTAARRMRSTFLMRSCLSFSERASRAVAMAVMRSEAFATQGEGVVSLLTTCGAERKGTLKSGTERSDSFVRSFVRCLRPMTTSEEVGQVFVCLCFCLVGRLLVISEVS